MRHGSLWPQDATLRTFQDVVLRIVTEAPERHAASDRLFLGRNDRVDAASLEPAIHLAVGIALVGRRHLDRHPGGCRDGIQLRQHVVALVGLSRRHLHVEHDAEHVIHRRVLLVGGLQAAIARARRHGRVRVRQADLLVLAGLPAGPLGLELPRFGGNCLRIRELSPILRQDRIGVLHAQALPRDVGADQRSIDMHHLALGDPGGYAALHRTGEYFAGTAQHPSAVGCASAMSGRAAPHADQSPRTTEWRD